jgi:catechol 2,3-dioxygenase-like lactoylglutathione lyase family enzyme
MLGNARIVPGFAVDDIARARAFYAETLGLDVTDVPLGVPGANVPAGLDIRIGSDTSIRIYPKADHVPATYTILTFIVPDIDHAVDELTGRGIRFQQYDSPRTDARGIHRTPEVRPVAWFTDPAGNILSLNES